MAKKSGAPKLRVVKNKTKASAPGAGALKGKGPVERSEDEIRALYIQDRSPWNAAQANLKAAKKRLSDVVATVKSHGFTKKQFEIGDDLATVKGEAKITKDVEDRLKVARWLGHPMGDQLDLFVQPDRTPIKERSYDAGKMASMQNEPRKPPHAPETEAYRSWMDGYEAHQRELAGGFKAPPASARPQEELH